MLLVLAPLVTSLSIQRLEIVLVMLRSQWLLLFSHWVACVIIKIEI